MSGTSLSRKVLKSVSWRFHASLTTLIVTYLYTGEIAVAGGIALTLMVIKLGLYVYHEKLWEMLPEWWNRLRSTPAS